MKINLDNTFIRWAIATLITLSKLIATIFLAGATLFVILLFIYLCYKFIQMVPKT